METLHITALGSSFAAGPGIPPIIDRSARRSGNNYAHILAKRLGARLTDLTVSGATLNHISFEPQHTSGGETFQPQITGLSADTDVVTITAGGNDLGYIGGMMKDALAGTLLGYVLSWLFPAPKAQTPLTAEDIAERFTVIINEIHKVAPECRIFLVQYFSMLGPETRPGIDVPLDEAQIQHYRSVAKTLDKAYKLAADAGYKCEIIPVAERSLDHCLGSKEPWVEGVNFGAFWRGNPFHPNLKGMQAVADLLYEKFGRSD